MEKAVIVYANYAAIYEGNFFASQKLLANEMKNYGIKTIYILPQSAAQHDWPEQLKSENIEVYYQPQKAKQRVCFLTHIMNSYEVLFIHTHFIPCSQILEIKVANLFSKRGRLPIVEHFHNHYSLNRKTIEFIKRKIVKNDYFVACSKDVYENFATLNLKNEANYVENAIDFTRLDNMNDFPFEKGSFNVMIFGFDYYRKGVDIALNALDKVSKSTNELKFYICLSANKEEVKKHIEEQFGVIPEWVQIIPARNDIATYYANMDLFISPSREEGFCYSIIEAAYCNTLCVATDISGQRKRDMEDLVWCEVDANSLYDKIEYIINLPEDVKDKKRNNLKHQATDGYGINKWVEKMIDIYKEWGLI